MGVSAAALAESALGSGSGPPFWAGAVVASLLPDSDLLLDWALGHAIKYHRYATHSLLCAALASAIGIALAAAAVLPVGPDVMAAWAIALCSHPLVDVASTGPRLAAVGYGIALFWPLSRRRIAVERPLLARDDGLPRGIRDHLARLGVELTRIGPVAGGLFGLAWWLS